MGTLSMSSLVHTPWRSGSPHGVLGAAHVFPADGFDAVDVFGAATGV
jgi:hypothetical protein